MTPEVVPSKKPRRILYVATGTCVVGACAGALACVLLLPPRVRAVTITPPPVRVVEHVPVVIEPAKPPPITDVQLLITDGDQTYLPLDLVDDLPKHDTPTLTQDGEVYVATAEVPVKNLPSYLRKDWKTRTVIVDGTCEAHLSGFAIVARVRGSSYDEVPNLPDWTAKAVMEHGNVQLMARLDGCTGTFARDAVIPGITVLADTNAPGDLAERAMKQFITEDAVLRAQDRWREAENEGNWYEASGATFESHVMRHPRTGEMWVVIHAYRYEDCGEVGGNVIAFYRVEPDGKLTAVKVRTAGIAELTNVIDLEGDGTLEVVGKSMWDVSIENADGKSVTAAGVQSFGCGC